MKLNLGCYESAVPDRFKVEIATRRATSPAQEEPSQRNNDVPKIRPQLPFVIFASSCANFLGLLLSPTLQIQASLGRSSTGSRNPAINRRATVQVLQLLLWKSLSPMGSVQPSRWDVAIFFMIPGTSCLATIVLSLRDKNHSPIGADGKNKRKAKLSR